MNHVAFFNGYRDRNKSKEDMAAEKEARTMNDACAALKIVLLEYLQSAQEGRLDKKELAFLIDRLEEVQGYYASGKMVLPGQEELTAIRKSIAEFTAALTGEKAPHPAESSTETIGSDEFSIIKELLIRQQEMLES